MTQWTYRIIIWSHDLDYDDQKKTMEELGNQGWELVETITVYDSPVTYRSVFKKEKSEETKIIFGLKCPRCNGVGKYTLTNDRMSKTMYCEQCHGKGYIDDSV